LLRVSTVGPGINKQFDAVYDALGRRIRTTDIRPTGRSFLPSDFPIDSRFDPEVEFLELGVVTGAPSGRTPQWKVYGPDSNGEYGGLQGIGGLEAVYDVLRDRWDYHHTDQFGSRIASGTTIAGRWQRTWRPQFQFNGYGLQTDETTERMTLVSDSSTGDLLDSVTFWRGKRIDSTGLYWMGARYYDPVAGRFLSSDPLGHGSSPSLYDYAGGDPVNKVDPDGRFAHNTGSYMGSQTVGRTSSSATTGSTWLLDAVTGPSFKPGRDPYAPFYGNQPQISGHFNLTASRDGMTSYYQAPQYNAPVPTLAQSMANLSMLSHAAPGVSTAVGAWEFFTGRDPFTGNNVSTVSAAGTILLGGLSSLGAADDLARFGTTAVRYGDDLGFAANSASRSPIIKCFPRGTKVETPKGQLSIEDIRVGDLVLARDNTGNIVARPVAQLVRNETSHWVDIRVGGETLKTTGSHPFWVVSGGWTHARDLRQGMVLQSHDGREWPVEGVEKIYLQTPEQTFNFEVTELHNYFAGTARLTVLTHNTDPWEIAFSRDPTTIRASDLFDHGALAEKGWSLGDAVNEARRLGRLPSGLELTGNFINDHRTLKAATGKRQTTGLYGWHRKPTCRMSTHRTPIGRSGTSSVI